MEQIGPSRGIDVAKPRTIRPYSKRGGSLYGLGALGISLFLVTFPVCDLDLFWHLANGRLIAESGQVVNSEQFSFTHYGAPFANHAWLAQLLLFRAWSGLGVAGLYAVKWGVVALVIRLLWKRARAVDLAPRFAFLMIPLVILAGIDRYHVRPELFSILGTTLLAALLFEKGSWATGKNRLWSIPVLFVIWDGAHGAAIGWLYLLTFVSAANIRRLSHARSLPAAPAGGRVRLLNLSLAATAVVGLINPYGPRSYRHFMVLAGGLDGADHIVELQPMLQQSAAFIPFLVLVVAAVVLATVSWRSMDLVDVLPALVFVAAAMKYSRLVAVAAIVVGFAVFKAMALARVRDGVPSRVARGFQILLAVALVLAGADVKLAHIAKGESAGPFILPRAERAGLGLDELRTPAAAVRFVQDAGIQGRYYNNGNLGGYLAYHMAPRRPIFQYNMPPIFGDTNRFVRNPALLTQWNLAYAFAATNKELTRLFPARDWAGVFSDYVTTVVVRRTPENADLIKRYELQHFAPEQSVDTYRAIVDDPARRPRMAFEMGVYLAYARDPRIAARWRKLLEDDPSLRADPWVQEVQKAASDRNGLSMMP